MMWPSIFDNRSSHGLKVDDAVSAMAAARHGLFSDDRLGCVAHCLIVGETLDIAQPFATGNKHGHKQRNILRGFVVSNLVQLFKDLGT